MRKPNDKSPDPVGGRAAGRLRDFLKKRLPPEEVEAQLEKQTNIKKKISKNPSPGKVKKNKD